MRRNLTLALLGLLVHSLWALTIAVPVDWDPRYYGAVARHIAAGEGAITAAIWNLTYLPEALPFPADIHWMPLPSRVLVPGVWLWPAHGDQATTVLLAALWAPLAASLARRLYDREDLAWAAGLCAIAGGAYARFLSTPDSIALYGLIGGLSWWAMDRERPWTLVLLAFAAGLCRGDGALLGLCLAAGWRSGRPLLRLALGAAGLAANGLWLLRNLWRFGDAALAARAAATGALDYTAFARGEVLPPSLAERGAALLTGLPGLALLAALIGVFVLPWPALWGAWRARERPWVRAAALYGLWMPLALLFGAPAVGGSGSVFRSAAALFPAMCVLAVGGLDALGALGAARRGYPRALVLALGVGAFCLSSAAVGLRNWQLRPQAPDPCPELATLEPGMVVFAADPLAVESRCGRPAVLLPRGLSPERAAALAARYDIRAALPGDPRWDAGGVAALPDDARRSLPGWVQEGRLLRAQ